MTRYKMIISCLTIFVFLLLSACSGGSNAPVNSTPSNENNQANTQANSNDPTANSGWSGEQTFVSIGGAAAGGSLYALAVGVADLFSKQIEGVQATGEETGGSLENMNLLHQDKIDIGHGTPDVARNAARGNDPFKESIDITLGWRYANSHFHIIVKENSGIESVSDMGGKRVAIGSPGSAGNTSAVAVLKAYGLDESDFTPVYLGWNEAAEALQDGSIDAAFNYGTIPAASIQSVIVQADVKIISIDPEIIEGIEEIPFETGPIPAGTYDGISEDVIVPIIASFAFINPDLPEALVYEMAKLVDTNPDAFPQMAPGGKGTRLANDSDSKLIGIDIHPGVVRYIQEKEGK